ncbi:Capsule biosynthesis protein CapA [Caloramator mitchellensis]|uniref:Capsule biosynthesis protein CapA n=1 Tax=Caloramator mitchellensis TaxID=908809 RepID=A0A0R3JVF3_CALMK|nr:CapA family protein [Caloramator mitchellensis]KRQ87505.1 Capsule biosynthesis protein CapA [Caloramator mitchellensis]
MLNYQKKNFFAIILLIVLLFTACINQKPNADEKNSDLQNNQNQSIIEQEKTVKIVMAGDVIFHKPQLTYARTKNGYDFKPSFEDIKYLISDANISVFNLEGNINTKLKPSGYPKFNYPIEAVDALKWAGFDGVVLANNHSLDTGLEGLKGTIYNFNKKGLKVIGAGKNSETRTAIYEVNGIKVGFLAYTQFINFQKSGLGYVNMIDIEKIKSDITRLKGQVDFCIVYMHHGTEYLREVEKNQITLYRKIADLGADYIVGNHPHVARKSEYYKTKDGRGVIINYSLGNFISNQNDKYTDIGLIARLELSKKDKTVEIKNFEMIPIYRLRYKESGKTMHKVITAEGIEKYKNKIGADNIKYITKTFDELEAATEVVNNMR